MTSKYDQCLFSALDLYALTSKILFTAMQGPRVSPLTWTVHAAELLKPVLQLTNKPLENTLRTVFLLSSVSLVHPFLCNTKENNRWGEREKDSVHVCICLYIWVYKFPYGTKNCYCDHKNRNWLLPCLKLIAQIFSIVSFQISYFFYIVDRAQSTCSYSLIIPLFFVKK